MKTETKVQKPKVLRAPDGKFLQGTPPCTGVGRPSLGQGRLHQLWNAIYRAEAKQGKKLLDHFCERAFVDDRILISLMHKLVPDLQAVALVADVELTDELALSIQKKLKERFKT